jgi:hypothetical protein
MVVVEREESENENGVTRRCTAQPHGTIDPTVTRVHTHSFSFILKLTHIHTARLTD